VKNQPFDGMIGASLFTTFKLKGKGDNKGVQMELTKGKG